jgi:hypothetical protein
LLQILAGFLEFLGLLGTQMAHTPGI